MSFNRSSLSHGFGALKNSFAERMLTQIFLNEKQENPFSEAFLNVLVRYAWEKAPLDLTNAFIKPQPSAYCATNTVRGKQRNIQVEGCNALILKAPHRKYIFSFPLGTSWTLSNWCWCLQWLLLLPPPLAFLFLVLFPSILHHIHTQANNNKPNPKARWTFEMKTSSASLFFVKKPFGRGERRLSISDEKKKHQTDKVVVKCWRENSRERTDCPLSRSFDADHRWSSSWTTVSSN